MNLKPQKGLGQILFVAGIYNIIWGTWVVLLPRQAFLLTGADLPKYLELWQCIGMIVAVYGFGYIVAASSPLKHWPITLVGLLGKLLLFLSEFFHFPFHKYSQLLHTSYG